MAIREVVRQNNIIMYFYCLTSSGHASLLPGSSYINDIETKLIILTGNY
jgi:hypothetical protein